MVVILAAGQGSRMGLEEGVSKCSVKLPDGRSSVRRLIDQFKSLGETKFVVVIGYGSDSVVKSVGTDHQVDVSYVYNGNYSDRGCNYSLACAEGSIDSRENVIVVEGDLVTSDDNLQTIVDSTESAVLVRPPCFLSEKSVAVICDDDCTQVLKFVYDKSHHFKMQDLPEIFSQVFDSSQVWKISRDNVLSFKNLLAYYKDACDFENCDEVFRMESGILSLNNLALSTKMRPLYVPSPDNWVNLNKSSDIELLAKEDSWYSVESMEVDIDV